VEEVELYNIDRRSIDAFMSSAVIEELLISDISS